MPAAFASGGLVHQLGEPLIVVERLAVVSVQVRDDEVAQPGFLGGLEDLPEGGDPLLIRGGDRLPGEVGRVDPEAVVLRCLDHLARIREPVGLHLLVACSGDGLDGARGVRLDLVAQRVELDADVLPVGVILLEREG